MNILGLSDWRGSHDSSAALVCDGRLLAAAEEERFSRVKHDGAVPLGAIDFCLRQGGMGLRDIDCIAFAGLPFRTGANSYMAELDRRFVLAAVRRGTFRLRTALHKSLLDAYLAVPILPRFDVERDRFVSAGLNAIERDFGELPPIRYLGHHACHAAAAYLTSSLDAAALATIDGVGDFYATVAWKAQGAALRRLRAEAPDNSLGLFYYDCTQYLGLGEHGEGKTMGLAPYGDPRLLEAVVGRVLSMPQAGWYRYAGALSPEEVGFAPRAGQSVLEAPFVHLAAACQARLEAAVARVVEDAAAQARCDDLCLGGGVMLNCASNGALLAAGRFKSISVFPATGDAGLSIGAALLCAARAEDTRPVPPPDAYLGPAFSDGSCEAALAAQPRIAFQKVSDVATQAAALLAQGKVIGWFQGRMEMGPRALGNRSILADPRAAQIRDRVNRLKGREEWRPLAPSVTAEKASHYFELSGESPYMLFASRVRPDKRALVAGVVHVDGSARPQTVRREQNPRYYDLLRAFERHAGVPMLLNTSFNAAGEPIVCSPEEAVKAFLAIGLDALVLGDYVAVPRPTAASGA